MVTKSPRSMVRSIELHEHDAAARLKTLRMIVAQRLDETESARETGTLSRAILDIEAALKSLQGNTGESPVDDLLKRRAARGAK